MNARWPASAASREVYEAQPKRRRATNTVHRWWYRQLQAAGLVGKGVRSPGDLEPKLEKVWDD